MRKPFKKWIWEQIDRNDPIGDLVRDMDRDLFVDYRSPARLIKYIERVGSCECHKAAEEAVKEWKNSK